MPKLLPVSLFVVVTTVVLWSAPAQAQNEDTWTGEVIDLACYVTTGATGEANKKCHLDKGRVLDPLSVKNGQPMGLLTDDGTLVLLVPDDKKSAPFEALIQRVGEKARVTGRLIERDGLQMLILGDAGW